jgi:hypothetical protein
VRLDTPNEERELGLVRDEMFVELLIAKLL